MKRVGADGNWDDRYLVLRPGERIRPSYDETVLQAAPEEE